MSRPNLSLINGSKGAMPAASGLIISNTTEPLSRLMYRVKSGKLTSVSAVRDRGAPLAYDGDFVTRQELLNFIRPGHAKTCIAEGLVALGAVADGPVTLDGEGTDLEQRPMVESTLAGIVDKSYREALAKAGLLIGTSA